MGRIKINLIFLVCIFSFFPFITPAAEKDNLLPLKGYYQKIERVPTLLNGETVHLYPSAWVISLYKLFQKSPSESDFGYWIQKEGFDKTLDLDVDSTVYFSADSLKQFEIVNFENRPFRNGEFLAKGKYIFVIDMQGRFLVVFKKREGVGGRIHHSSICQGDPVISAGRLILKSDRIILTNYSGHYKPSPENLNRTIQWLSNHEFRFHIQCDTYSQCDNQRIMRKVVLLLEPGIPTELEKESAL